MGCTIREGVRAADDRRRERNDRFHEALNAALVAQGIPQLPPASFAQLRRDLTRLPDLRAALQVERRRRRDVLRGARAIQQTSGCTGAPARARRAA